MDPWRPKKTQIITEYLLPLERVDRDGNVWRDGYLKWDGCGHYSRYFNAPRGLGRDEDVDGIHICSIAEMVGDLLDMATLAQKHFGQGEWVDEIKELERALEARGWVRK